MAKCKQCNGTGTVQDFYTLLQKTCPECNGAREVEDSGQSPMEHPTRIEEPPREFARPGTRCTCERPVLDLDSPYGPEGFVCNNCCKWRDDPLPSRESAKELGKL